MSRLTRRALLPSSMAAALIGSRDVRAQPGGDIGQPLIALYSGLESAMRAGHSVSFVQRFDALAPLVDRAFDLGIVLRVSVGMRWDAMDPEVQARLLKAFRRFTVATYVANFDKYDGERFQVLPGSRVSGADRIVRTEIISGNGDRMRLDYLMRDDGGAWRIVDVLLDGSISRVAVQRSDFRKILAGGDADALIASLHRKIADLSEGALSS
nr:ABC transporter substrate-binding protein [uncultured Rhodopila sp.]